MKKIIAVFAFLSLALMVSCSSGNGPEDVAKKFVEANSKADFATAKKYADEQTGQMLEMMAGFIPKDKQEELKKKNITIEIVSSEEKDSTAVVKYNVLVDGKADEKAPEAKSLDLKKIKGEWKVTMNKEGMPGAQPKGAPQAAPATAPDTIAAPAADTTAAPAQ